MCMRYAYYGGDLPYLTVNLLDALGHAAGQRQQVSRGQKRVSSFAVMHAMLVFVMPEVDGSIFECCTHSSLRHRPGSVEGVR